MKELEEIAKGIEEYLDELDAVRELAIKSARAVTRLSGAAIAAMHRGEETDSLLNDAKAESTRLAALLGEHPQLLHSGLVESAFQELAEAWISTSIMRGERLPTPRDLGISPTSYLLGLGDSMGELRRLALEALRGGTLETAGNYLVKMETIYDVLMRFDYPNALVPIKRKQDIARSLLEKTRGEVAVATRGHHLEKRIEELRKEL
jgi:translin